MDFGGRPVHFIRQHNVGEDGTGLERKSLLSILAEVHLRAGDIGGQQIGRKLDATEVGFQVLRQALHGPRLGQTGQALDQDVAVSE